MVSINCCLLVLSQLCNPIVCQGVIPFFHYLSASANSTLPRIQFKAPGNPLSERRVVKVRRWVELKKEAETAVVEVSRDHRCARE